MMHVKLQPTVTKLFGVGVVIATWQIVTCLQLVSSILLPAPASVSRRLFELLQQADFWEDFTYTTLWWLLSTVVGTIVGLMIGLLSYLRRGFWHLIEIPVEFIRSLPSVVLVPLVSNFAGAGGRTQFISASIVVAALMIASFSAVVRNLPVGQDRMVHAWRINRLTAIKVFVLPNLRAEMFVALRAAVPLSLVVLIASDMLVATEAGLGKLIRDGSAILDMQTTFATVLAVGLLGYCGSLTVSFLDRLCVSWRRS